MSDERLIRYAKQQFARAIVRVLELHGFEVDSPMIRELVESDLEDLSYLFEEYSTCNTTAPIAPAPESSDCVTKKKDR